MWIEVEHGILLDQHYTYPDTIPDIRIFRISRGEAQGSYAQLRLRAASEVTSQFDFETSRAWILVRIVPF